MDEMTELEMLGVRREVLRIELSEVTEKVRLAALAAYTAGDSEAAVARAAKVDRMTMRKWLGKR